MNIKNKIKSYKSLTLFTVIILIFLTPVIIQLTNLNILKPYISKTVNEILGRQLHLNGDLKLKFLPAPNLIVRDVQFQNANWSKFDDLIKAKEIDIKLSLLSLLKGEIVISAIRLDGFNINLERNNKKGESWDIEINGDKHNIKDEK